MNNGNREENAVRIRLPPKACPFRK